MSLTLLIIDTRASHSGTEPGARSLLSLPAGAGSVLDQVAAGLDGVVDSEVLVLPTFPVTPAYGESLQAGTRHRVRVMDQRTLARRLQESDTSDRLLLTESRVWAADGLDVGAIKRCLRDYRGAVYGVAVGADVEATRELVECDDQGAVRRVQRFYNSMSWPEMANSAVLFAILPSRALVGIRLTSLGKVRSSLSARGVLSWDLPLPTDLLDMSHEPEFLAVQERILSQTIGEIPQEYACVREGVFLGPGCRVDPSARLIGPLILQDGVTVGEGATIVGPSTIGSATRVGAGATVVQCVLAPETEVPSGAVVRHRVVSGLCLAGMDELDPQSQATLSAMRPPSERRYSDVAANAAPRMKAGTRWHRVAKRLMDVCFSALGLLVLSPLLVLVAILVKLTSRGPIFFAHRRETRGGVEFPCVKFRTMCVDADHRQRELRQNNEVDGPQFKMRYDPRVTWLGRWLRATNIDELPQLFNVLAGHMSLVGPRPSPFRENQICVPWRRARLSVRPGITGLWQICRDDDRSQGDFHQWIYYDITYVRNFSFWLDIKILLATLGTLGGRWSVPLSWVVHRDQRTPVPPKEPALA